MARTIETEVEVGQEAISSEAIGKHDSLEQEGRERQQLKDNAPSRKLSRWILLFAAAVAVAGATLWWLNSRNYESTDDAQIEGHLDLVSPRISGTVSYINPRVENNQFVEAGALLLELDPRDYEAELDHAKADLDTRSAEARSATVNVPIANAISFGGLHSAEAAKEQAMAGVEAEQANLDATQHKLQQDEAIYARAERDRVRYQALVEKREISRSDYDARETEAAAAAQAVEAARVATEQVTDARAKSESAGGHMEQARADLHSAQLNLSYTKIYAPVSGVIGRKTVELGHRVQPGQGLLVIVPLDDIWITANFKETQLKRMSPGQSVTIRVDTFGRDYKGKVESLPGAAGPLFSLFPPENSTGNYVKVVQRFPVRIRLDKDQDAEHLLRPGMSVEPTVDIH